MATAGDWYCGSDVLLLVNYSRATLDNDDMREFSATARLLISATYCHHPNIESTK